MGEVKRYDDIPKSRGQTQRYFSAAGDSVAYSDYARLERERDVASKENANLRTTLAAVRASRNEARECVGRLCSEISEAVKMLGMDRPISPAKELAAALAATPEHLRS